MGDNKALCTHNIVFKLADVVVCDNTITDSKLINSMNDNIIDDSHDINDACIR